MILRDDTLQRRYRDLVRRYPLVTFAVDVGGRTWTIEAVQNQDTLIDRVETDSDLEYFPYGLLLWASAVGLAREIVLQRDRFVGRRVLELGAGAGLPGLVARSCGATVTQTDYHPDALTLCRMNALRNGIEGIRTETLDWRTPHLDLPYDWVIGSDILYERTLHRDLRRVVEQAMAPRGRLLVADPLRPQATEFVDGLAALDWTITMHGRNVDWEEDPREIALFDACGPGARTDRH